MKGRYRICLYKEADVVNLEAGKSISAEELCLAQL
jgi:hypothetical protein